MIKNQPDISIIIPVYNVQHYIERCLQSVFAQQDSCDLECLIIDDGSTDQSMSIVRGMISGYDGKIEFRIFSHKSNKGVSAARNTGLKEAKGEYVFFLDSDDHLEIDALDHFVTFIRTHPGLDMIIGDLYVSRERQSLFNTSNVNSIIEGNYKIKLLLWWSLITIACNKLVKLQIIKENNVYFKEGLVHEDEIWNYQIAHYLNAIGFINSPTYFYSYNPLSIMNKDSESKRISNKIKYLSAIIDELPNGTYSLDYKFVIERIMWFQRFMLKDKNKINQFEKLFDQSMILFDKIIKKNKDSWVKTFCTLGKYAGTFHEHSFYLGSKICFRLNYLLNKIFFKISR